MVREIRTDTGQVNERLHIVSPQPLSRSDAREHQQLRGPDRARAQYDLGDFVFGIQGKYSGKRYVSVMLGKNITTQQARLSLLLSAGSPSIAEISLWGADAQP